MSYGLLKCIGAAATVIAGVCNVILFFTDTARTEAYATEYIDQKLSERSTDSETETEEA